MSRRRPRGTSVGRAGAVVPRVGPVVGDGTVQQMMSDFTVQAKAGGHSAVRVVQSDTTTLWWVLSPISFVTHPVIGDLAGHAP